jgi:hypothetical protein
MDGATTFTLSKPALIGLVTRQLDLQHAIGDGTVVVQGDASDLLRLTEHIAPVDPGFAIVTP